MGGVDVVRRAVIGVGTHLRQQSVCPGLGGIVARAGISGIGEPEGAAVRVGNSHGIVEEQGMVIVSAYTEGIGTPGRIGVAALIGAVEIGEGGSIGDLDVLQLVIVVAAQLLVRVGTPGINRTVVPQGQAVLVTQNDGQHVIQPLVVGMGIIVEHIADAPVFLSVSVVFVDGNKFRLLFCSHAQVAPGNVAVAFLGHNRESGATGKDLRDVLPRPKIVVHLDRHKGIGVIAFGLARVRITLDQLAALVGAPSVDIILPCRICRSILRVGGIGRTNPDSGGGKLIAHPHGHCTAQIVIIGKRLQLGIRARRHHGHGHILVVPIALHRLTPNAGAVRLALIICAHADLALVIEAPSVDLTVGQQSRGGLAAGSNGNDAVEVGFLIGAAHQAVHRHGVGTVHAGAVAQLSVLVSAPSKDVAVPGEGQIVVDTARHTDHLFVVEEGLVNGGHGGDDAGGSGRGRGIHLPVGGDGQHSVVRSGNVYDIIHRFGGGNAVTGHLYTGDPGRTASAGRTPSPHCAVCLQRHGIVGSRGDLGRGDHLNGLVQLAHVAQDLLDGNGHDPLRLGHSVVDRERSLSVIALLVGFNDQIAVLHLNGKETLVRHAVNEAVITGVGKTGPALCANRRVRNLIQRDLIVVGIGVVDGGSHPAVRGKGVSLRPLAQIQSVILGLDQPGDPGCVALVEREERMGLVKDVLSRAVDHRAVLVLAVGVLRTHHRQLLQPHVAGAVGNGGVEVGTVVSLCSKEIALASAIRPPALGPSPEITVSLEVALHAQLTHGLRAGGIDIAGLGEEDARGAELSVGYVHIHHLEQVGLAVGGVPVVGNSHGSAVEDGTDRAVAKAQLAFAVRAPDVGHATLGGLAVGIVVRTGDMIGIVMRLHGGKVELAIGGGVGLAGEGRAGRAGEQVLPGLHAAGGHGDHAPLLPGGENGYGPHVHARNVALIEVLPGVVRGDFNGQGVGVGGCSLVRILVDVLVVVVDVLGAVAAEGIAARAKVGGQIAAAALVIRGALIVHRAVCGQRHQTVGGDVKVDDMLQRVAVLIGHTAGHGAPACGDSAVSIDIVLIQRTVCSQTVVDGHIGIDPRAVQEVVAGKLDGTGIVVVQPGSRSHLHHVGGPVRHLHRGDGITLMVIHPPLVMGVVVPVGHIPVFVAILAALPAPLPSLTVFIHGNRRTKPGGGVDDLLAAEGGSGDLLRGILGHSSQNTSQAQLMLGAENVGLDNVLREVSTDLAVATPAIVGGGHYAAAARSGVGNGPLVFSTLRVGRVCGGCTARTQLAAKVAAPRVDRALGADRQHMIAAGNDLRHCHQRLIVARGRNGLGLRGLVAALVSLRGGRGDRQKAVELIVLGGGILIIGGDDPHNDQALSLVLQVLEHHCHFSACAKGLQVAISVQVMVGDNVYLGGIAGLAGGLYGISAVAVVDDFALVGQHYRGQRPALVHGLRAGEFGGGEGVEAQGDYIGVHALDPQGGPVRADVVKFICANVKAPILPNEHLGEVHGNELHGLKVDALLGKGQCRINIVIPLHGILHKGSGRAGDVAVLVSDLRGFGQLGVAEQRGLLQLHSMYGVFLVIIICTGDLIGIEGGVIHLEIVEVLLAHLDRDGGSRIGVVAHLLVGIVAPGPHRALHLHAHGGTFTEREHVRTVPIGKIGRIVLQTIYVAAGTTNGPCTGDHVCIGHIGVTHVVCGVIAPEEGEVVIRHNCSIVLIAVIDHAGGVAAGIDAQNSRVTAIGVHTCGLHIGGAVRITQGGNIAGGVAHMRRGNAVAAQLTILIAAPADEVVALMAGSRTGYGVGVGSLAHTGTGNSSSLCRAVAGVGHSMGILHKTAVHIRRVKQRAAHRAVIHGHVGSGRVHDRIADQRQHMGMSSRQSQHPLQLAVGVHRAGMIGPDRAVADRIGVILLNGKGQTVAARAQILIILLHGRTATVIHAIGGRIVVALPHHVNLALLIE